MSSAVRIGICGAGWPGLQQAKGCTSAGGFKVVAVADLIPSRRETLRAEHRGIKEFTTADELIKDPDIDAVGLCLPNNLHAPVATAALPPASMCSANSLPPPPSRRPGRSNGPPRNPRRPSYTPPGADSAATNSQPARQSVNNLPATFYHVRATWMRTRGMPQGTGWYTDKSRSGGGALIDLGAQMLDLAWHLLGQPKPISAFGVAHQHFAGNLPEGVNCDVDDAAFAMLRFENGKSIELAASWAINQAPQQQGAICRAYGNQGAVEVYTSAGAMLFRHFDAKGQPKASPLPGPKVTGYTALARHFRECILGKARPIVGGAEGVRIMQMIEAVYHSSEAARSVAIK